MEDGADKTIWGLEQREWLMKHSKQRRHFQSDGITHPNGWS